MIIEDGQAVLINHKLDVLFGRVVSFNSFTNTYLIRIILTDTNRICRFQKDLVRRFILPEKEVEELLAV